MDRDPIGDDMDKDYDDLVNLFANTTDPKDMAKLFEEMLTPNELKDLLLRWNLMKDLYKGLPQREIAASYKISLCKITRGSKILKQKDSYCKRILSDRFDDHLHI
jgi:TrpR family trp operon transcriptional repressor